MKVEIDPGPGMIRFEGPLRPAQQIKMARFGCYSVRPKHPFCVSAETETFRPVAEPKHRNVSAEPKQSSNVTIPPKSEYFNKHFTTLDLLI